MILQQRDLVGQARRLLVQCGQQQRRAAGAQILERGDDLVVTFAAYPRSFREVEADNVTALAESVTADPPAAANESVTGEPPAQNESASGQ